MAIINGTPNDDRFEDALVGTNENDVISGFEGRDELIGNAGDDFLEGGDGDDTLEGGSGNDSLFGGSGDDLIIQSGSGTQLYDGGDGNDTYLTDTSVFSDFTPPPGFVVQVDLNTSFSGVKGSQGGTNDTVENIENVITRGDWDWELIGDDGDNVLTSGLGDDLLQGGGGDDTLNDGGGVDTLDGGAGNDTYRRDLAETFPDEINFVPVADLTEGAFYALAEGPNEGSDIFIDIENIELSGDYDLQLIGDDGANRLSSGAGDDTLEGGAGDDQLTGNDGVDTAVFEGAASNYILEIGGGPSTDDVEDKRADGTGSDVIDAIELLEFGDGFSFVADGVVDLRALIGTKSLTQEQFSEFIELYIAYFNRAPDALGLNFWATSFANGTTLEETATLFVDQDETRATYPEGTSNNEFATSVYDNVLGRTPDQAGIDFWVGALDSGNVSRDQFILDVLRGAKSDLKPEEGQAFVDQQLADRQYLEDKVDIGAYYAVHKGMSDVGNASAAMSLFDGSQASIDDAVSAIDGYYQDALDPDTGEFLIKVLRVADGVLDDPFSIA